MNSRYAKAAACLLLALSGSAAMAGVYDDWVYRTPITLSGYDGASTLTSFPALVVLGPGISGFSNDQFRSASGGDLRFADSTETTGLAYEVESWSTNGNSYVWVQVPQLSGASTLIYAYWGGPDTTAPAGTNVWDSDYVGVWHMQTNAVRDSTANGFHVNSVVGTVTNADGVSDGAQAFDSDSDYVQVPDDAAFTLGAAYTVSAVIRSDPVTDYEGFVGTYGASSAGFIFTLQSTASDTNNTLRFWAAGTWLTSTIGVPDNEWKHLAYAKDGTTGRFYMDGTNRSSIVGTAVSVNNGNDLQIGAAGANWSAYRFSGLIDEVRVSKVTRSADWLRAEWLTLASNSVFTSYGSVGTQLQIENRTPTNVTAGAAWMNGYIVQGPSSATVSLYWGDTDGGEPSSGLWKATNIWTAGQWPSFSSPTYQAQPLSANTLYFYRYAVSDGVTSRWASATESLVTGDVNIETARDGKEGWHDGEFVVTRPAAATNGDLVVYYSIDTNFVDTATLGPDYTLIPAAGSVTIPAGAITATITVDVLHDYLYDEADEQVKLDLLPRGYVVGPQANATATITNSVLATGVQFDVTRLRNLEVGVNSNGVCDLTLASIVRDGATNVFTVVSNLDLFGANYGVLRLNPAVTNVQIGGDLVMSDAHPSVLDFGSDPQLQALSVSSNMEYSRPGQFIYNGTSNGLPPGAALSVGTHAALRTLVVGRGLGGLTTLGGLSRFDARLSSLSLAPAASSQGAGELDLRTAEVVTYGIPNTFAVTNLYMGDHYSETAILQIPETVTNFVVSNLYCAGESAVDLTFGSNSQLAAFRVLDRLQGSAGVPSYSRLRLRYTEPNGSLVSGFPPSRPLVRIGDAPVRRGTMQLATARGVQSFNLGPNIGVFDAYIDSLTLGAIVLTGGTQGPAVIDTRGADVVSLDATGMVRVGNGTQNRAYLYLQNGTAVAKDVEIGKYFNSGGYGQGNLGLVWVSNLVFRATNSVEIDVTGIVTVQVSGASAGFDVETTGFLLNTALVAKTAGGVGGRWTQTWYGVMALDFVGDPTNSNLDMWGLRVRGDQRTYIDELTNAPVRLRWTTNGLSASAQARFGVHFNESSNWTFIGVISQSAASKPDVFNRPPTNVTTSSAYLNGYLASTGDAPTTVKVYWGLSDGGVPTSGLWERTNAWAADEWPADSYPSYQATSLTAGETYYYRYYAENAAGSSYPNDSTNFVTGGVTIQGTGNAKEGWYNGQFTVYRPATCADELLAVNVSIDTPSGDPATHILDYTLAPSNVVYIQPGQTSATIAVEVVFDANYAESIEYVKLTLQPGSYAVGSPSSAEIAIENAVTPNTVRLDVERLRNLEVGTYGAGAMDISGIVVQSGENTNLFTATGNIDLYFAAGQGVLRLPGAVTNIDLGGYLHLYGSNCRLDLGTDPQLTDLSLGGGAYHDANAAITYSRIADGAHTGLPPALAVSVGTPGAPATLRLGQESTRIRWGDMRRFSAYLGSLELGIQVASFGDGDLDLRGAEVVCDGLTNEFRAGTVRLGQHYTEYGILRLPGAVTNVVVSNLLCSSEAGSYLEFGSNSVLQSFTVHDDLGYPQYLGNSRLRIQYLDGAGAPHVGFPPSLPAVKVGLSDSQRGTLDISTGARAMNVGPNMGRFEGYLDALYVGTANVTGQNGDSLFDARECESVTLDVSGRARIGNGTQNRAYVYLQNGTAKASDLDVGVYLNWGGYNQANVAFLWMSNLAFRVTNSVEIGLTGDVRTFVNGTSAGIDLTKDAFTVSTGMVGASLWYGKIDLKFLADPQWGGQPYWGLRVGGDKIAELSAMTSGPARLTWDISGLSPVNRARFGIFYSGKTDQTYVGVPPPPGTFFYVR